MGKKQPAHEIKLGKIRVTIWANETEDHDVWFNVGVSRLYKSGDTWKETATLKHDDLPIAMFGSAGGQIETGRHLSYRIGTPLTNLYRTVLAKSGAAVDSFSDSTGELKL